jgi:2-polyprenyl-6-methoxyphenol hydroxylase-like FAD-dependent oxidoreductase
MHRYTDVLIVGAGPVGLGLATKLQRQGVSALIIDRHRETAQTSRACVIHARTLEVLEPLSVTSKLLTVGVQVPIFRIRDRDRALATFRARHLTTLREGHDLSPDNRQRRGGARRV